MASEWDRIEAAELVKASPPRTGSKIRNSLDSPSAVAAASAGAASPPRTGSALDPAPSAPAASPPRAAPALAAPPRAASTDERPPDVAAAADGAEEDGDRWGPSPTKHTPAKPADVANGGDDGDRRGPSPTKHTPVVLKPAAEDEGDNRWGPSPTEATAGDDGEDRWGPSATGSPTIGGRLPAGHGVGSAAWAADAEQAVAQQLEACGGCGRKVQPAPLCGRCGL
jgi:hypothetical protein